MKPIQKIATLAVGALLGATVYGLFRTKGQPDTSASTVNSINGGTQAGSVVDQSSLWTARWLAQMPITSEERQFRSEGQPDTSASTVNSINGGTQAGSVVDQSSLWTARWLAQMPITSEERQF